MKIGNSFNVDAISYENRFEGITQPRTVQYSTVQYSTVQYSTVQYDASMAMKET